MTAWLAAVLSAAGLMCVMGRAHPLPGTTAPGRSGVGAAVLARLGGQRRRREDADAVLGVCDALAAELLAGRPPGEALASAGAEWVPLRPVVEAFHLGADVPGALRSLADRRPGAGDLRLLAAAWDVAHSSGQGLARAVERTARGIRQRRRTRRVVESELASARATARLVCVLPFLVLAGGSGVGGSPWRFLLTTGVGWLCLGGGAALIGAGLVWIEAIARRAAPA